MLEKLFKNDYRELLISDIFSSNINVENFNKLYNEINSIESITNFDLNKFLIFRQLSTFNIEIT